MEETIEREAKQWDIQNVAADDRAPSPTTVDTDLPETKEGDARALDTVGATTNKEQPSSLEESEDTNMKDAGASEEPSEKEKPAETSEGVKDHGDNGEEVVEGEEDTVIY